MRFSQYGTIFVLTISQTLNHFKSTIMTVEEIKKKKRVGDNELVASLVGISAGNVTMVFRERPTSKRYAEIIEAFTFVIQTHEKMIREYRDKKEKENSDNL